MAKAFVHCDMNPAEYLTVAQYAAMHHYSNDAIRVKIKNGYLKAIKVKGAWYIPKDANRAGTGKKQQPERIYQDGHYWLLTEAYVKKYQCSIFRIKHLIRQKRLSIIIWQGRRYIKDDFLPPRKVAVPVPKKTVPVRIEKNGCSWILSTNYAAQHNLTEKQIQHLITKGKLPRIRQYNRRYIPEGFIVNPA